MPKKYFYGVCENCKTPTPKKEFRYCRPCFWNPERRFWSYADKTESCWNWTRAKNAYGYGVIQSKRKSIKAHRFAWQLTFGKIPNGICVLHRCDNRACINPDHLFLGTKGDNNRDKTFKNRQPKGISHGMHKLSESDISKIRKMYRKYSRDMNQIKLAKMFHVKQTMISNIVNHLNWKHL